MRSKMTAIVDTFWVRGDFTEKWRSRSGGVEKIQNGARHSNGELTFQKNEQDSSGKRGRA